MRNKEDIFKKKILIYCDTWATGGIETFIVRTITHMKLDHLDIHLYVATKETSNFDAVLKEKNIEVKQLQKNHKNTALKKTLGSIYPLIKLLKRESYDIVHLNVFHGLSLMLALACRMCFVHRIIVHCHGAGFRISNTSIIKRMIHSLSCKLFSWVPTQRLAASKTAGNFFFSKKYSISCIPNGVDTIRFMFNQKQRDRYRASMHIQDDLLIGCVGRLDSQKNQSFLIGLLAKMKESNLKVKLLIVGEGESLSALKILAQKLNVVQDVIFYGYCIDVSPLLFAMDCLLVPSLSEGLCIAALEGQASGLPVICSTGVPEEVKQEENVKFLDLGNMNQWIYEMMHLPDVDRELANHNMSKSIFDINQSVKLLESIYLADG